MTEASSRKPRELIDEEERIRTESARPRLILKFSKREIFNKIMAEWYVSMKDEEKKVITPLQLKRKAVKVCFSLSMVYDTLPADWIKKLEDLGLKLKRKEKKKEEKSESIANVKTNTSPTGHTTQKVFLGETMETAKKLVDLTKSPPPPFWLENYAKGIILPRMLSIHSTDDANVLFYDYNPKLKDEHGQDVVLKRRKRHTGHKMLSFESKI